MNNDSNIDYLKPFGSIYWMGGVLISILLFSQIFPPLLVLDSTSLKHFIIGVVNTLCIVFFLFYSHKHKIPNKILSNKITYSWLILILMMFISFFQSINIEESIVTINRWIIIFLCFVYVSIFLEQKPKLFRVILNVTIIISAFNILSCIIPYYYFDVHINPRKNLFLNGLYGNKNMFAAAILFKLPFLYYAFFYRRRFLKWFSLFLIFGLIFCLVIISARTSFIGLIIQALILLSFALYQTIYLKKSNKWIKLTLIILATIIVAFFCSDKFIKYNYNHYTANSSIAEKYNITKNNYTVANRFKSIEDGNSKGRLKIWHNTIDIIKEKPFLGYGVGNQKVAILKVEAPQKDNFINSDHAHNDYLEMWSELGIFGLISYLLFLLSGVVLFIKTQVKKNISQTYRFMSLIGFMGLVVYANDAMFNFPLERGDIQMLFAFSLALILIPYLKYNRNDNKSCKKYIFYIIGVLTIVLMAIESMHFYSSIVQKEKILQTNGSKKIKYSAKEWGNRFPSLPTIDENGNPIALSIGMRYAAEKKYRQAVDIIINDNSNPYYGLKEYRLSNYYFNLKLYDSSFFWADKCISMKPLCYEPVRVKYYYFNQNREYNKADSVIRDYLLRYKMCKNAWLDLIYIKAKLSDDKGLKNTLDSALFYFTNDSTLFFGAIK